MVGAAVSLGLAACGPTYKALYVGFLDTCAVRSDDAVYCWGYNMAGNLGEGSSAQQSATPVRIEGLAGSVASVAPAFSHTCALLTSGAVQCWGKNLLGVGSVEKWGSARTIEGLPPTGSLTTNTHGTCALTTDAGLWCWGGIEVTGSGTTTPTSTPARVSTLDAGVTQVVGGDGHICALTASGVFCWGEDSLAQLGDGVRSWSIQLSPVAVRGLPPGVQSLAAGAWHTCALTSDGSVWCWGGVNGHDVDAGTGLQPFLLSLPPASSVSAGGYYTCVIETSGGVTCSGARTGGAPVAVKGLPGRVRQLAVGNSYGCALIEGGDIWCWGFNRWGSLGNGSYTDAPESKAVKVGG